jgi:hypothetical protein
MLVTLRGLTYSKLTDIFINTLKTMSVSHYGGRSLSPPWCRTHVHAHAQILVYPLNTARCQSSGVLSDGSAVLSFFNPNIQPNYTG